jgi:hypothetical protein
MARQQQQLSKAEILQSQWQDIRTSGELGATGAAAVAKGWQAAVGQAFHRLATLIVWGVPRPYMGNYQSSHQQLLTARQCNTVINGKTASD